MAPNFRNSEWRATLLWVALAGLLCLLEWRLPVAEDMEELPEQRPVMRHAELAGRADSNRSLRR